MKKVFFAALGLCLSLSLCAQLYVRDEVTGYYNYTGEEIDQTLAVDFSDLQPTDVLYTEGTIHDSKGIIEFQNLGLYKFCYYASRTVGTTTYGPLLWNNNTADDGTNAVVDAAHAPTVYTPVFKNGIHYVIVKGWCLNAGTLWAQVHTGAGWVGSQTADASARGYLSMQKNAYTVDTLIFSVDTIKQVSLNRRNGGGYFFLHQFEVIPYGHENDSIAIESFSINETSLEMEASQTKQLIATIRPFNATVQDVVWESSNTDRATVDATGLVTAVAPGAVTITATCGTFSAKCEITIKGEIAVTSVTLGEESMRIAEGKYARISAVVLPTDASNPTVTWTSSDTTIVTVAPSTDGKYGLLRGMKEGKAVITAKAGAVTATCDIEVYWEMPEETDYELVEYYPGAYYYEWYGELQTEPIVIDFTKWTYDSLPDPLCPDFATMQTFYHSAYLTQRYNIGFYKYCMNEGRNLGNTGYEDADGNTVANVLWNQGYTNMEDGTIVGNGSVPGPQRPAMYFPAFKNGIKQIRFEGVSYTVARSFFWLYKDVTVGSEGQDSTIMNSFPYSSVPGEWGEFVFDPQGAYCNDIHNAWACQNYLFIGRIEVIPEEVDDALDEVIDDRYEARAVTGGILFNAKEDITANIYSTTGATLFTVQINAGVHTMVPMPVGLYIVNHQKVFVNR